MLGSVLPHLQTIFNSLAELDEFFAAKKWDEKKHPRGQPENAGEFAPSKKPKKGINPDSSGAFKTLSKQTDEEREALWEYTDMGAVLLNKALRRGKLNKWNRDRKRQLDQAIARSKFTKPVQLYRGVSSTKKFKPHLLKVGSIFISKGYFSTTSRLPIAHRGARGLGGGGYDDQTDSSIIFSFVLPKGTHAARGSKKEKEYILERSTRWRVLSIKKTGTREFHANIERIEDKK